MRALLLHEATDRGMRGGTEEILDHLVRRCLDVAVPVALRKEFTGQLPQAALEKVQLPIQIVEAITEAPARAGMRPGMIATRRRHDRLAAAAQQLGNLIQNRWHAIEH
ncbi:hypothetical protein MJ435_02015, partial [Burkholderia gladioli]